MKHYNHLQKSKILDEILAKESKLVAKESMRVLSEFEAIDNGEAETFGVGLPIWIRSFVPRLATSGLEKDSDIMIDQLRAIDKRRLISKLGVLPKDLSEHVKENLIAVLGLDL